MSHWWAVNSCMKRKVETAALRPRLNTSVTDSRWAVENEQTSEAKKIMSLLQQ